MAKRKKKIGSQRKARRKVRGKARRKAGSQTRPKTSRVAAALERARVKVTEEVLAQAMAGLPARTTMGEVVTSIRSAGFAKDFEAMSLSDFVAKVGNAAVAGRLGGRKAGRGGAKRAAARKVNTRTEAGREKLDADVAAYLTSAKSARAEDIRAAVGGTSAQVRQALTRLMEAKKVSKKGQKRATEYSWGRRGGSRHRAEAP